MRSVSVGVVLSQRRTQLTGIEPAMDCDSGPQFSRDWVRRTDRQTDRQTDILLTEIKVITDLFVIVIREIYVHVYTRMLVC